jgi:hypothetical protein
MRHISVATVTFVAVLAAAQQPCATSDHREGNSVSCSSDVSQQQQPAVAQTPELNIQMATPAVQPKAFIVFFRPSAFYGSALKPSVYVDGQEIGRLGSGKYLTLQTAAGPHTLSSSKKGTSVEIRLTSEQTQYVEMVIQSGNWRGAGRLIPVPADEGTEKTKKLKLEQ